MNTEGSTTPSLNQIVYDVSEMASLNEKKLLLAGNFQKCLLYYGAIITLYSCNSNILTLTTTCIHKNTFDATGRIT